MPSPSKVTLQDVLITDQLAERTAHLSDREAVTHGLRAIANSLLDKPETVFHSLLKVGLKVCNAGSAGLSMLETASDGSGVFRWTDLVGKLEEHRGKTVPRDFSPCGVTLDRGSYQLFSKPGRYFPDFRDANVVEGLVLPMVLEGHTLGTLWIVMHDEKRRFDMEDVLVMQSLAGFAVAATRVMRKYPHQGAAAS